jgi:hypothetical protein
LSQQPGQGNGVKKSVLGPRRGLNLQADQRQIRADEVKSAAARC